MKDITISPYEVLGLSTTASVKDIKRQYKRLIRVHTPESSPKQFMTIRAAYDALQSADNRFVDLPLYQQPMAFLDEIKQQSQHESVDYSILTKVFESPFNTNYEIHQLIKVD